MAAEPGSVPREPGARAFVFLVWAGMSVAAFAYVHAFGPEIPLGDDYVLVPYRTGTEPLTMGYLWSQHNEHRVPLPRLVLLGLDRVTGHAPRAGMYGSVAAMAALAGGLAWASARARGSARSTDAAFPLLVLHFGHHDNLLWNWQVAFTLPSALTGLIAGLIATERGRFSRRRLGAIGAAAGLLPLCGANGLVFLPPVLAWLGSLAFARARRDGRKSAMGPLMAAIPGLLLTLLYFIGYRRPQEIDGGATASAVLRTGTQFLGLGFGPASGEVWTVTGPAVALLAILGAGWVLGASRRHGMPAERWLGLAAMLGGLGLLTAGLAVGRAGTGPMAGLEPRYVTLASLVPCFVLLIASALGPGAGRGLASIVVFAVSSLFLWPNDAGGLREGRERFAKSDRVVKDIRSGAPVSVAVRRASPWVHHLHSVLTRSWLSLRDARIEPFESLRDDLPQRLVPLELEPVSVQLATWDDRTHEIEVLGPDPWVTFQLPAGSRVTGVLLRYSHRNPSRSVARFKMGWRRSDQSGFPADQENSPWTFPTGENREAVFWIGEAVDQIRIQPDNQPCTFRIESIDLIVPDLAGTSRLELRGG